ncbi:glycosyltransferase family 2 protein [Variovorax paradoxus]|uniref:glycosyltransferase family 2 protein n=1 Tax=Variovorax paradoxus TaxID=34073 RepID=UPI001E552384|nr:glycosyltransferase family 2 protein [Variovorax paradoxus]
MSNAQLQRQIDVLEGRIGALQEQIRTLTRSTSWRVTAPLRWATDCLRRIARGTGVRANEPAQGGPYSEWVAHYDAPDATSFDAVRLETGSWAMRPRFLILVNGDAAGASVLKGVIGSLLAQTYAEWRLCLVREDAAGEEIRSLLDNLGTTDSRIQRLAINAVEVAPTSGPADWVVWLDKACTLPAHALFCVAREIVEHPAASMIYADEDRIDAEGRRSDPFFKPDWNPDLFLGRNLFSPLACIRASLFEDVGGLRQPFDKAPGLDLALRCIERASAESIRHIPRVLASVFGSTSPAEDRGAGERALNRHFERIGVAATAKATPFGFRTRYALPPQRPFVSLIIPTRNALDLVRQCIESIVMETAYPNYEILLVDNDSDDPEALAYFAALGAQQNITVIRDERPFNYSALNNAAVARARGELIGLVNNDIEAISPGWLDEMVSLALQPGVGAVGAKLLYPDMTIQHGGVILGVGGIAGHAHKHLPSTALGHGGRAQLVQSFSAVTAACLVVRKSLYEQVGGLDEERLGVAYNDVDFCLRLGEAGFRNVWTPYAELLHHESATRGLEVANASRHRLAREAGWMQTRWGALIANDPAYNPNLTLNFEDFDLAWPPRVVPLVSPHPQPARKASKP